MNESEMFKQFKERDKDFWEGVAIAKKVYLKKLFNKFDKFACIKDDKWYLDFKKDMFL